LLEPSGRKMDGYGWEMNEVFATEGLDMHCKKCLLKITKKCYLRCMHDMLLVN
jgi:hypothetical protein